MRTVNPSPTVDLVLDLVCPWCYVGNRRVERAIAQLGKRVRVRRRPFELDPSLPAEGSAHVTPLERRVVEIGRAEGIDFQPERITRRPNTFEAHRLVWYAGKKGRQDEVTEALFAAYFTEGRDLGARAELIEIGVAAGLDRVRVERFLGSDTGTQAVRAAEARAWAAGITSVPYFIVNGREGFTGAQTTVQALVDALER
jgi:predicted DsbA family dithiol-disulfide isomerase